MLQPAPPLARATIPALAIVPTATSESDTITAPRSHEASQDKPQPPKQYRVILLNDDYTPMEFVIFVLMRFFRKSFAEAERIMWQVHKEGAGIAGVYSYEIAETKVAHVVRAARAAEHPLRCTMEQA